MSTSVAYKQRSNQDRRAVLETDFSMGMMSTEGLLDEGYVKTLLNFSYEKESHALVPRPGIGVSRIILPDPNFTTTEDFLDPQVAIKASKECLEQGISLNQVILGKLDDNSSRRGDIWVSTSAAESDPFEINFSEYYSDTISYSVSRMCSASHKCYFYMVGDASVHKYKVSSDPFKRAAFPVGTFAFGNSYYFFGEDGEENPGLFRTNFSHLSNDKYVFETVTPKECSVSEAVSYGYNMLLGNDAYTFINKHTASFMQFEGILPYAAGTSELLMTPKKNQAIDLICFYNVVSGNKYDIVWEWRETKASDWNLLHKEEGLVFLDSTQLKITGFIPPTADIMIRVTAYPYVTDSNSQITAVSEMAEKAIVVGFDFTADTYGSATPVDQKIYDLTSASGMASWNGRILVWGVPEDPTVMFLSDYNDPSYFPYPNNIIVFDAPIIHATEFMDKLIVFTTDKLYEVTTADGITWTTTVLQSHLNISSWDRHLIQTIRNMVYFKSGNYYYMMVPKARSVSGELVLAPITTPITSFFDRFSVSVQQLLSDVYNVPDQFDLITYYNYLDYEDMHNLYAFSFDDTTNICHVDLIYNTSDRTWKVWIYEVPNLLYPYKHDATQSGALAFTSLFETKEENNPATTNRLIQVFEWKKLTVAEYYIPSSLLLHYSDGSSFDPVVIENETVIFPQSSAYVEDEVLHVDEVYGRVFSPVLHLASDNNFIGGFSKLDISSVLMDVYNTPSSYFTFENHQYLDTGYRSDNIQYKKRYREIQLQLNNSDRQNLSFGMDFVLDGAPRKVLYKYDTAQQIDEFDPDYGVVYVDSTPYLDVDINEIDMTNQWTIDQNLAPDINLWKVRISVSGKGAAPRLKLYSRNNKRFELFGINWISKMLHMR